MRWHRCYKSSSSDQLMRALCHKPGRKLQSRRLKECRSNPANYRPVSLTCILCKILEHIINRHILDHLDEYRILVDAQHGFRKRRSCETQLILTCHDLAKVVNDSGQVDMLVLDFAKAFDTVAHK